jgi:hypothetical protein
MVMVAQYVKPVLARTRASTPTEWVAPSKTIGGFSAELHLMHDSVVEF